MTDITIRSGHLIRFDYDSIMKRQMETRMKNQDRNGSRSFGHVMRVDTTLGFDPNSDQVKELGNIVIDRICFLMDVKKEDLTESQETLICNSILCELKYRTQSFNGRFKKEFELLYRGGMIYALVLMGVDVTELRNTYLSIT